MSLEDVKDEIKRTLAQKMPTGHEVASEQPTEELVEERRALSDIQCEDVSGGRVGDHRPPT